MSAPTEKLELFHAIADEASAELRRFVVEHGLEARLRFRNVAYPEVVADLQARGGTAAPAVWDGTTLHAGLVAARRRLDELAADAAGSSSGSSGAGGAARG